MHTALIKIADIVFGVYCDTPLDTFQLESYYNIFFCNESPEVIINGHYAQIPDVRLTNENKVFESDTCWDVYKNDGRTIFVLTTPANRASPYCLALFKDNFRYGDVYYQVSLIDKQFNEDGYPQPLAFPLFHLLMISILSQGYGILLHACAIDDRGQGYLFPGSSTHGKTTIARLWQDDATVLNDERIVLRQHEGNFWIYGTPWHGEFNKVSSQGVPLKKIFFLRKAEINSTDRLIGANAALHLLTHCFLPYWDTDGMNFTLRFCSNITTEIPCYELGFVPDKSIVDFLRCVK
jgi:hypothetical protein